MDVFIMRHAHAVDRDAWAGEDEARPLAPKGRERAEAVGRGLARLKTPPTVVVTSPLTRAMQTATAVTSRMGVAVVIREELRPGFGLEGLDAIIADLDTSERPLLIGHEPDLTAVVVRLVEANTLPSGFDMKPASCCLVAMPADPQPGLTAWKGRSALRWARGWREWEDK